MKISAYLATLFVLIFAISGCSHQGAMQEFNNKYYGGDLQGAYDFAKSKYDDKDDMVLWGFESGIVASQLNNQESFTLLDESEERGEAGMPELADPEGSVRRELVHGLMILPKGEVSLPILPPRAL